MTPCLSAIKACHPEVKITVLLEEAAAPLLDGHEMVDRVIVSPGDIAGKLKLIRELRPCRFDIAFNLHGGTTGTILAAASGARFTAGYAGYRHSYLLKLRAPDPDVVLGRDSVHSVEQQLALLYWTGVPWPASITLSLPVRQQSIAAVKARLRSMGRGDTDNNTLAFAIISPAAAAVSKRWGAQSFGMIAEHLSGFWRVPSLVIAGEGEEAVANEVAMASGGNARVIGNMALDELVALISMAKLFVGNDSGPMHIAAAAKKPIVATFGSSNPDVWQPWTEAPFRVLSPGRSLDRTDKEDHCEFPISRIPVGEVIKAVDQVMEEAESCL